MTSTFGMLQAVKILFFNGRTSVQSEAPLSAERSRASRSRCTVLAIDDDTAHLKDVRGLVERVGFNVLTAASVVKGLDVLRYAAEEIRVVLLDYNMPGLSGEDTVRYIRTLKPRVKIVGMSEEGVQALPVSFRDGVDSFLQKPLESETTLNTVATLLGVAPSTLS
jgi:DNA-binding NtrC family response regulator